MDHLRGWPLDLRRYSYTNSHRDVYGERPKPINPREAEPNRRDGDFMRLDGVYGGRGGGVAKGAFELAQRSVAGERAFGGRVSTQCLLGLDTIVILLLRR